MSAYSEDGPIAAAPGRPMSFGERAVGLEFNPSNKTSVYACKTDFARIIDALATLRAATDSPEVARVASVAITEAQTAQMWAVKALTLPVTSKE